VKNSINTSIIKTLVISLLFLSLTCRAESDTDNLVQFKIASLQLFSSFSAFVYFQGDDRNRTRLLNAMKRGSQSIAALPDSELALKRKWKEISDFVKLHQNQDFSGADTSLEVVWNINQREINALMAGRHSIEATGIADLQIKMEAILNQYMGYANSTTGGYSMSYGNVSLEEQIKTVELKLIELTQTDDKYQSLLKQWSYIQGTLSAYNSNVAPFVVLHTFDRMRKIVASY
jgi:hypothetical protein